MLSVTSSTSLLQRVIALIMCGFTVTYIGVCYSGEELPLARQIVDSISVRS